MSKLEIEKIPVDMYRTVHKKDANGNRVKDREKYIGYKKIKCVNTGRRIAELFVDILCLEAIFIIIGFIFGLIGLLFTKDPINLLIINTAGSFVSLLFSTVYYFVFEYYFQKTPGKFVAKTIVVNKYGEKPDAADVLLRTIIRIVPFEALSCFSDSNRGWHDRWSNTYVLEKEEYEEVKRLLAERQSA
ncbi:MAG: RDD family protein [Bacteroidia bacterium]